jgi:hypothetical protein
MIMKRRLPSAWTPYNPNIHSDQRLLAAISDERQHLAGPVRNSLTWSSYGVHITRCVRPHWYHTSQTDFGHPVTRANLVTLARYTRGYMLNIEWTVPLALPWMLHEKYVRDIKFIMRILQYYWVVIITNSAQVTQINFHQFFSNMANFTKINIK